MLTLMNNRNRSRVTACLAAAVGLLITLSNPPAQASEVFLDRSLSLAGDWHFQTDPGDRGITEKWFERKLTTRIVLPGSLQAQGVGNEVTPGTLWTGEIMNRSYFTDDRYASYRAPGNVKLPFWLTPRAHYVGTAWFQRDVLIPPDWGRKRVFLSLERCHWETSLWVDGQPAGTANSLSVPHVYDASALLTPGRHRITLRVDNRVKIGVGINAHSVSDHTQGNWNGVVGEIKLTATDRVWIDDLQVFPDLNTKSARVVVRFNNLSGRKVRANLTLQATSTNTPVSHIAPVFEGRIEIPPGESTTEIPYPLGNRVLTWDEFSPALYILEARMETEPGLWTFAHRKRATFGMREVGCDGTQFTINGRKTFLRGTLECCVFPLTGYPPTDVESWKRIVRICKAHGLNHMRFHSWCPPEAAFRAADELGFYYHVECASWANSGSTIGDGQPIDRWIYDESERILREYGNHPSFLMLAYGNEPAGNRQQSYLGPLVNTWRNLDRRHLYTGAAGWPIIPENDYHLTPAPRIQQWGEGLKSRINARPPSTTNDFRDFVGRHQIPVVSHEIGQWCAYPNFDEIAKYTGWCSAGNFEIFRDDLRAKGMGDQARDFLRASGKLQTLCYKEEIESALRTPGFGGFQLLDLHDFPGQGTALVGVLDAFWDSKGYVSAKEFSRFCSETVPLVRLPKHTYTSDEMLEANVEIAHFGPEPIPQATVYWRLLDSRGKLRLTDSFDTGAIPLGNTIEVGTIRLPLSDFRDAQQLKLVVGLDKTRFENDWDLWVYPPTVDTAPGTNTLVTEALDDDALAHAQAGGSILFLPPPSRIAGDVQLGFSPIFWNTAWTREQPPHTLGILCRPGHPALRAFPTDFHSNWQWWDLIHNGAAMVLDELPLELRPTVQVIDDWFKNRRLGLVLEARLGQGKILLCSVDLRSNLEERPVARQLLHSLLRYMDSKDFAPAVELAPEHFQRILKP